MLIAWSIVGLAVGVILNLLIARLPRREFPFRLPVRCRYCRAPLTAVQLSALSTYLLNRGRCRVCGHQVRLRYLLVELVAGILFAALYLRFGLSWYLLIYSLYISVFIVVFMTDLEHRLILNVVTYPSILLAVLLTFIAPDLGSGHSLLGGLFYGGLFMAFYVGALVLYRQAGALGFGDVKLALLIGLVTGLRGAIVAALLGTILGALVSLWLILFRRTSSKATMPYGPALAVGAVATILWSPWVG